MKCVNSAGSCKEETDRDANKTGGKKNENQGLE